MMTRAKLPVRSYSKILLRLHAHHGLVICGVAPLVAGASAVGRKVGMKQNYAATFLPIINAMWRCCHVWMAPFCKRRLGGVTITAGAVMSPAFERGVHDRWP
jgi:hypothetical protein